MNIYECIYIYFSYLLTYRFSEIYIKSMDGVLEKVSRLGRRKPFDSWDVDYNLQTPLKRKLSTFSLVFLCLGETLGFGIFLVNGYISKEVAGPGTVLSFVLAGLIALIPAACYAEFAAKLPRMGSSYDYIYVTMGEFIAFLVGWNLILEFVLRAISMAQMCSYTLDQLTDNEIQNLTISTFQQGTPWTYDYIVDYPNILGSICIIAAIAVVYFGANFTAKVISTLLVFKFAVVCFTIYIGIVTAGDTTFSTHKRGFLPYGTVGVIRGILPCYFAFTAFNTLGALGAEVKVPQRHIPRSITIYMIISVITYVLNAISLNLAVNSEHIKSGQAYFETFSITGHKSLVWGRYFIGLGSVCTVFSSVIINIFCVPRILLSMCTDGLLFPCLDEDTFVGKRLSLKETLIFGFILVVVTMFFKVHAFEQFQSAGILCSLILVSVALIILRYTPYRVEVIKVTEDVPTNEDDIEDIFEEPIDKAVVTKQSDGKISNSRDALSKQETDEETSTAEENIELFSTAEPDDQQLGLLETELSRLLPSSDDEIEGSNPLQMAGRNSKLYNSNIALNIPGSLKTDLHHAFDPIGRFSPGAVVVTCLLSTIAFQVGFAAVVTSTGFPVLSKSKVWSVLQVMLLALSLVSVVPIYLHYQRERQKGISEVIYTLY